MVTTTPTRTSLQVDNLTVRYGDTVAVDSVSFSARSGEILGLLGPNGAGKTSVIRALTTIVAVAGGTATIAGCPLTDARAVRARIGVLPESNGYPSGQSGPAYLRYYGQLFGLPRSEAASRAGRLLERMGLGGNEDRISTYSRGMRQRLGLARALLNNPEIVFLDEPTLGLDPAGKEDIMAELTNLASTNGTTIVLCSHLLDEVERVCDRVAIMHAGRIVADGTVDSVVRQAVTGDHNSIGSSVTRLSEAFLALTTGPPIDRTKPREGASR